MKPLLTYGEAWYDYKERGCEIEMKNYESLRKKPHLPKMKNDEAAKYYTEKINAAFKNLGIIKKITISKFEQDLPAAILKVQHKTHLLLIREARKIVTELAA